jgi:large subunit ribosomal protein L25
LARLAAVEDARRAGAKACGTVSGPFGRQAADSRRAAAREHHNEHHKRLIRMPDARPALVAQERQMTGKAVSKLRREGRLPGVVYGHGVPSTNVTLDAHEFDLLRRKIGANELVDLTVGDNGKSDPVLIHDIQVHPVNRRPLHVDLFLVRMTEELIVDVPLQPTGSSRAVRDDGGTLLHAIEEVRVRALPDRLPRRIEYSIDSLEDFEATIHVRDLVIPPDVTLLTDPDDLVARVLPPRVEEVAAAPTVAEGAPEAEGAEGAAPAEGAAAAEGAEPAEGGRRSERGEERR